MFPTKRRSALASAAVIAGVAAIWCSSAAADARVNTGYFGGVAIMGYDPVAYFAESRAVKGSPDFSHEFLGQTWHFASAENRDAFAARPVAYAPQYGGYCAGEVVYADVTTGITMNIDPEAWRIIDGKLYLFYQDGYAELFERNAAEWIAKADTAWPVIEARLATE